MQMNFNTSELDMFNKETRFNQGVGNMQKGKRVPNRVYWKLIKPGIPLVIHPRPLKILKFRCCSGCRSQVGAGGRTLVKEQLV